MAFFYFMANKEERQTGEKEKEHIHRVAMERFETVNSAEDHIRNAAEEDIKFAYNIEEGQWPQSIRDERDKEDRPFLTANKLNKFVKQVANRERDMRMAGDVEPVDDIADPFMAKVIDGIIREIEYRSDSQEIYTSAGEQAVAGGFGYWRYKTQYLPDSFDQEIIHEWIENQFSCYMDPKGQYAFIREGMTKAEYERRFPGKNAISFDTAGRGDHWELWYEDDKVFIAEYFFKEPVTKTLVRIRNQFGNTINEYLDKEVTREWLAENGWEIIREEKRKTHKVMWCKLSGAEVLEMQEWPGMEIPIVEVVGDKVNIQGKVYKRSLIRDAKSMQQMFNYWLTATTETVALQPKAPFIADAEQIGPYKKMWDNANKKNLPYLLYDDKGRGVKPQRQPGPQVPPGTAYMMDVADANIKDTLGMYEPTLGEQGNERSGRAIFARKESADTGTYHFPDNLRRAILRGVKILIDLIPKIYDGDRVVRLRDYSVKDNNLVQGQGADASIRINFEGPIDMETGKRILINDISAGKYDFRADIKKSSTRRQEAADFMMQSVQYAPNYAHIILPLAYEYQDFPGAQEIANGIRQVNQQMAQAAQAEAGATGEEIPTGMEPGLITQGG
jgi:hypothetical protein